VLKCDKIKYTVSSMKVHFDLRLVFLLISVTDVLSNNYVEIIIVL